VIRRLVTFIGATLAVWLAAALVARALWGDSVALGSAIAVAVCLVPAVVTLLWSEWALAWAPQQQVTAVLGGTGVRIFVVALAALILHQQVEFLRDEGEAKSGFWTWVIFFYLVTLALEVAMLLWAQAEAARKNPQPLAATAGTAQTANEGR